MSPARSLPNKTSTSLPKLAWGADSKAWNRRPLCDVIREVPGVSKIGILHLGLFSTGAVQDQPDVAVEDHVRCKRLVGDVQFLARGDGITYNIDRSRKIDTRGRPHVRRSSLGPRAKDVACQRGRIRKINHPSKL